MHASVRASIKSAVLALISRWRGSTSFWLTGTLNRVYYKYVDDDKEVKKVDPITLREDAPIAYHFPPDVVECVDWSGCPVVREDPERVHGAPTFANTRLGL